METADTNLMTSVNGDTFTANYVYISGRVWEILPEWLNDYETVSRYEIATHRNQTVCHQVNCMMYQVVKYR